MFIHKHGYLIGCCDETGCKNEIQTGVEISSEGSAQTAIQRAFEVGWAVGPVMLCPLHAGAQREAVDHPSHYNTGKIEVIAAIEDWKLGFHEGNVVKYVARAEHKGKQLEDLKKARWYLDRRIEQLESAEK